MKKFYLSADIEGTCGIVCWDETEAGERRYDYFARQMSREVAAACEGLIAAGAEDILVRDAHDSARNVNPELLPERTRIFRNWDTNPLSHTMNTKNVYVKLNGELCPELMINCLTASYVGVPVVAVTGDKGLCDWIRGILPGVAVVPVIEGVGGGSVSIHPNLAVKRIRAAVEAAAKGDFAKNLFPMPEHFEMEVRWREHSRARSASFYPGCRQTGPYTAVYAADDWMDVLKFMHWVL